VLLGADDDPPVGLVHVTVAPGGGMPEHDHGASTVVLIPVAGTAQLIDVADDDRTLELLPGTITTVPVGRRVRLHNAGSVDAQLLVVVSPPDFARQLTAWPAAA
jgi:mannose-6-phosphate isomerase-like protein (cupin superfamily)